MATRCISWARACNGHVAPTAATKRRNSRRLMPCPAFGIRLLGRIGFENISTDFPCTAPPKISLHQRNGQVLGTVLKRSECRGLLGSKAGEMRTTQDKRR